MTDTQKSIISIISELRPAQMDVLIAYANGLMDMKALSEKED